MNAGRKGHLAFILLVLLLLGGCAARNPMNLAGVDSSASPTQVRRELDAYRGRTVQWGGLIVNRLGDGSQSTLEVLSYPLRADGNPDEYLQPTGLFRFRYTGGMDLSSHQPGRFVTVVGEIVGLTGDAAAGNQPLPLVQGDQVHLWGKHNRNDRYPRTTFGFGLGLHF